MHIVNTWTFLDCICNLYDYNVHGAFREIFEFERRCLVVIILYTIKK